MMRRMPSSALNLNLDGVHDGADDRTKREVANVDFAEGRGGAEEGPEDEDGANGRRHLKQ